MISSYILRLKLVLIIIRIKVIESSLLFFQKKKKKTNPRQVSDDFKRFHAQ